MFLIKKALSFERQKQVNASYRTYLYGSLGKSILRDIDCGITTKIIPYL